jgi:Mn-dependent DtxR family transcriptional regulator
MADIRKTLDAFLLAAHKASEAVSYERAVPLTELATAVGIGPHLAEKVADFLEGEGLVDYDDQAIDITIEGILRAEDILRGGDKDKDKKASAEKADNAEKPAEPNGVKATAEDRP